MAMIPLNLRLSRELWFVIQHLAEEEQISAAQWVRERLWAMAANEAGLRGENLEALMARAREQAAGEQDEPGPSPPRGPQGRQGDPPIGMSALAPALIMVAAFTPHLVHLHASLFAT